MLRSLTAVCLVALFALPALAGPKVYTSKALGFSAIFPYEVKEQVEADGSGTVAAFHPSGLMYMVGVVVSNAETQKLPVKDQLDGGIAGAVAKVKGTLVSQKDIMFGRHHGREAEIDVPGAQATFRFYIIGAKAYMMGVVRKTDAKLNMEPITFFGSFKLVR